MAYQSLEGIKVLSLAANLPGGLAAAILRDWGASVTRVEPPWGEVFATLSPYWYEEVTRHMTILRVNLKDPLERSRLDSLLTENDLLLTSYRPTALQRLGLDWQSLQTSFPHLSMVAITGYPHPEEERPGHDLNYQAKVGLVRDGQMPAALLADTAGAIQTASAGLALLVGRSRTGKGGYMEVSLASAADFFALPSRYGVTQPGGLLGGGLPGYSLYPAQEGWVAVAALEPHFWQRLLQSLGLEDGEDVRERLRKTFLTRTAAEWETWAVALDLPLVEVKE